MKNIVIVSLALVAAGCAARPGEIGREPVMTPVGSGLDAGYSSPVGIDALQAAPPDGRVGWGQRRAGLYRDPRASAAGDLLTVKIAINDRASLDNSTDRSRDSSGKLGLDMGFSLEGLAAALGADAEIGSKSSSKGRGSTGRSENIELSIAAVVTALLPNGNLLIRGTQEVRVNYEMRVLTIAGIVRPEDISDDNTISYDKIAEARVSYGGRGRLMEVQQPAYGQQVFDLVTPY